MKKILLLALVSTLFMPSISSAGTSGFYGNSHRNAQVNRKWWVQPIAWNSELDGHFKVVENKNPNRGQRIDIDRDTRNLDKERAFGLNISREISHRSTLEFNAVGVKHDGNLGIARVFKGKNYSADSKFKIKNNIYDLLWNYHLWSDFCNDGREKYHISCLVGVKASDFDFSLKGQVIEAGGPAATQHTSYSEVFPIPYIGLEYGTFIGKLFYLKAAIRCMDTKISDYDAAHYDYNVNLAYRLSGEDCLHDVLIDIGYRYINYDAEGKGNDIDLEYKGPYIGFDMMF